LKQYGLIGFPLSHSFSKEYFSKKFLAENILNVQYENYPFSSVDNFPAFISDHPALLGLNVTIPFKESIIRFLSDIDQDALQIGAVNCIRIRDHQLTGYNTDFKAFTRSLLPDLQPAHRKALILGTGGASKAIAFSLRKLGIEFLFVSRRKQFKMIISYDDITEALIHEYTLIINTTPVGMFPDISSAPDIPYQFLSARHFLFDLIYNPDKTVFLKRGSQKGTQCKNGREMLIFQAEESWKIWNQD
jgi:shikimate dehydrogenase